jgi:RNA-directed DNA polymerase
MVSALGNGVKGGEWFRLIDKVIRPATLDIAWQRVARNEDAAGVDGQSIERFSRRSDMYLAELQASLANGSYTVFTPESGNPWARGTEVI